MKAPPAPRPQIFRDNKNTEKRKKEWKKEKKGGGGGETRTQNKMTKKNGEEASFGRSTNR